MTRDETIKILEHVCRLYVVQAKRLSAKERSMMLEAWTDAFKFDSYEDVSAAVDSYVKSGKPFIPNAADIVNMMISQAGDSDRRKSYTEADKLFGRLERTADMLANEKEHQSIIDPGGFKWDPELKRKVYYHPEVLVSRTSFTQYDFAELPPEIQEYVEDIEGLRSIWHEIESNRMLARSRFENELPEIKAELARRSEQNIREHMERLEEARRLDANG